MLKRSFKSRLRCESEEGVINLTPLIDVVFVVLIAFILVAPMLEVDHLELAPSSYKSEKEIIEKSRLQIFVRSDNSIWLQKAAVPLNSLLPQLKKRREIFPTEVPQLFLDEKAHFGIYQRVKNALEVAGFSQVDLILQPKEPNAK